MIWQACWDDFWVVQTIPPPLFFSFKHPQILCKLTCTLAMVCTLSYGVNYWQLSDIPYICSLGYRFILLCIFITSWTVTWSAYKDLSVSYPLKKQKANGYTTRVHRKEIVSDFDWRTSGRWINLVIQPISSIHKNINHSYWTIHKGLRK